ncbi:hypothetical protein [Flavobacterium sp. N2038]|uniref:hypothetical protein n=1 Tax=Flavobacterium sp. N2038 TaxID=2986829 RepID=UPI0022256693|nr:hypothetical protein [Flavobacterium sp. N2038]
MTKRIIFSFLFCVTFIGNAQSNSEIKIDSLVSNYIKKLQSQKIDTICIYESYCVGCRMLFDSNSNEICDDNQRNQSIYIFWKRNKKTYLTKISTCSEYSEVNILQDDFWEIYFSNQNIIKKEKFKQFEYFPYKNFKEVKCALLIDHSPVQNFKMIIKGSMIKKEFNSFQMKEQNDDGIVNINYKHNNRLKSNLIMDILEKTVSEAEKNNTFKKIKSR